MIIVRFVRHFSIGLILQRRKFKFISETNYAIKATENAVAFL